MSLREVFHSLEKGQDCLIVYPDNDVFLSISKLIADEYGRNTIGWFVFNEIGKKRLEKYFKTFQKIAPERPGKVFMNYDEIDREIILGFGYHFHVFTGYSSDESLIRLVLDDEITFINFLYSGVLEDGKQIALRDLFDYIIDIEEKEAPLGREFFYRVKAYVYPHTELSGSIKIDSQYNLIE